MARANGLSISSVMDLFVKQIALTGELNLLEQEDLERELLLREVRATVQKSIDDYENGRSLSLEEVRARFGV